MVKDQCFSTIHICWGAQAGLYYHYGVPKYPLKEKMFGNFKHHIDFPESIILKGFGDVFHCPHSRHTEVRRADIEKVDDLIVVAVSNEAGVHLVSDKTQRQFFLFGHWEYDRETLEKEYFRDKEKGLPIQIPYSYFPDDDPQNKPIFNWSCSANLFIQTGSTTAFIRKKRHMILMSLSHWGLHNEEWQTYS